MASCRGRLQILVQLKTLSRKRLDQMARYHANKTATRKWLIAILDWGCIKAYILYCKVTKTQISRRDFLLAWSTEMCQLKVHPVGLSQQTSESSQQHISRRRLSSFEGHPLQARHKQDWGRGFILLLPQTAALPESDAGSGVIKPASSFVIQNRQTSCSMWCPMYRARC